MTRDARLAGPAFAELVAILVQSLPHEYQINTFITKLDLARDVPRSQGDPDAEWTSLLGVVAERPEIVDQLLGLIDYHLKNTGYRAQFVQWRSLHSPPGPGSLDQAVSEVQNYRNSLLAIRDPRKGQLILGAMRYSIIEIKEMVEAMRRAAPGGSLMLAATSDEGGAARNAILDACGYALEAVDQLATDVDEADRLSVRFRQAYSAQEAFAANRSMTRLLLADRSLVDHESSELLRLINEQLPHLATAIREQGQTTPQPYAGP